LCEVKNHTLRATFVEIFVGLIQGLQWRLCLRGFVLASVNCGALLTQDHFIPNSGFDIPKDRREFKLTKGFFFFLETRSPYVVQSDLELLVSSDSPASALE
jgi:hypothetical protein